MAHLPRYVELYQRGELAQRAARARRHQQECDLCGRHCRVDRREKVGACQTAQRAWVASFGPHHGEENPLRGWNGSGTIFFGWCNLRCIYCQNHDISHAAAGRPMTSEDLAAVMVALQEMECHNINLVSPSHVVAEILEALVIAVEHGLRLPLVYNTGGYDSLEALKLLDGVIDIYMPDMKYGDSANGRKLSKVPNYVSVNQAAVREMHRQVGDLVLDEDGIAQRGVLIRHLVLPNGFSNSSKVFQFLAQEISPDSYINIMSQYRPAFKAEQMYAINRRPTPAEVDKAYQAANQAGLHRFDKHWRRSVT
ncbi:MAG: radical SAM protein [Anaerolineales bacterium]|jgi:putative pyruvate formate lyase activating enzyme